tara:strand:- start:270 stop:911 length:642 start_codon:yes stop_codon:yes gene_type:complete
MNNYMADELIQVVETPTIIEDEKPKKKEKKKRAPMSAEKKEKLLANLALARAKAAANRKAKKEAKSSVSKPKKVDAKPSTDLQEVRSKPAKVTKPAELDPRDIELAQLRERVKTMTLQDVIKKPKKRVKKQKQSAAIEDTTDDEVIELVEEATRPSPQKTSRAKPPAPSPPAPAKQTPPTKMEATPSLQQTPVNIAKPVPRKKQLFGRGKKRR